MKSKYRRLILGIAAASALSIVFLKTSGDKSESSTEIPSPSIEQQISKPDTARLAVPDVVQQVPSDSERLDQFRAKLAEALEPMKGSGTKVIEHTIPPTKKLVRLPDGTELVELTYEHGGKTYLPKGEDTGIGNWAASTK